MSLSQPQPMTNAGTTPLERFDELLFENPEVCSRCYSKIRDHETHDLDRLGNGNRPTETLQRAGHGIIGQAVEEQDHYGVRRTHTARTFCGECGIQSGRADGRHIHSIQAMRGLCDNVVRRLHEQGLFPDITTLYGTVVSLKRDPDHQGRDRQILATAVELALRKGSEADVPGRPVVVQSNAQDS